MPREVDCLVLGGGITGGGVARDLAMRGLRVLLVDSHDFASGTSHLTSKIIHGGLRYLEHGHIRPVIEGIIERDRLLTTIAPNLVTPMRFIMPFEVKRAPAWLAALCSLQVYGFTEFYRERRWSGAILGSGLRRVFPHIRAFPMSLSFWDAQTNDARLVLATLRTAAQHGATLLNYTSIRDSQFYGCGWNLELHSDVRDCQWSVHARTIVNATGPWSPTTAGDLGVEPEELMWIKGSHILLKRPESFGNDAIVIRSLKDNRPLWAVPWQSRLLLGSTESRYTGDLRQARPTKEEVADLFDSFVSYFPNLGMSRSDIRCAFAGVRPIIAQDRDSENSLSRRHRIGVDRNRRLITVNGGKLTTFRLMAEQTGDAVCALLGKPAVARDVRRQLRAAPLWPGLTRRDVRDLQRVYAHRADRLRLPPAVVEHLLRLYGTDAANILEDIEADASLADVISDETPYTLGELSYLCRTEHVCHLLDLVKRRTSLYFLSEHCSLDRLPAIIEHIAPMLGWDKKRQVKELSAVAFELGADTAAIENSDLLPKLPPAARRARAAS